MEQIGLYQIHWPGFITNGIGFVNDNFVHGLADCKNQGLVQASLQRFKARPKKLNRTRRLHAMHPKQQESGPRAGEPLHAMS